MLRNEFLRSDDISPIMLDVLGLEKDTTKDKVLRALESGAFIRKLGEECGNMTENKRKEIWGVLFGTFHYIWDQDIKYEEVHEECREIMYEIDRIRTIKKD